MIGQFLYSVIILPIESIIEFVFCFVLDKFSKFGVAGAIVAVSLVVNFLALPIYNVADDIQLKEREIQKKMKRWVTHIKKAFHGDEQFMMLSVYYRQNNYHPLYALRQSLSVLIQIPFFIAAYHFLSHCSLLENQSILFLKDLSKPDALIHLTGGGAGDSGIALNLLPILMTAINIASSVIYTKGAPLREKIQTFALAGIFLVLLYNSPSGLVFYWVLNQIFSLCKNVVNKTKSPNRIWHIVLSLILVFVSEYVFLCRPSSSKWTRLFLYVFTVSFCLLPLIKKCWQNKNSIAQRLQSLSQSEKFALWTVFTAMCILLLCINGYVSVFKPTAALKKKLFFVVLTILFVLLPLYAGKILRLTQKLRFVQTLNSGTALFVLSCLCLALLCGLLLPVNVIASSPEEFSFLGKTDSPLSYVWSSFAFFIGLFVFWPLCIYKMFGKNKSVRSVMPPLFFVIAICALANAFLFKYNYGLLSLSFTFDNESSLENKSFFFSIVPIVFLCCVLFLYVVLQRKIRFIQVLMIAVIIAQVFVSGTRIQKIQNSYKAIGTKKAEDNFVIDKYGNIIPQFNLSKTEKNVVVLFLDRAISCLFPYILEEFPELKSDFDGFVYYPNCLSFGGFTILGAPPLLGGYEYTPTAMNERSEELLKDKNNEAILLMPKIFSDAGFNVTVADLPYVNFKNDQFDTNFFKHLSNTKAFELHDKLGDKYISECAPELFVNHDDVSRQKIKYFCLLEIIYPPIRKLFYNNGNYYSGMKIEKSIFSERQITDYAELFYLSDLTEFNSEKPTFTIFVNMTTHFDTYFTMVGEDYHLSIDTTEKNKSKSRIYNSISAAETTAYHVNAASCLLFAKWIRFLKENNCYDNTRIIVVADHGTYEDFVPFRHLSNMNKGDKRGLFNPLLLVKDFYMHGEPVTDDILMTNAETPLFAIKNLPVSDVNPFTSKKLQSVNDFSFLTVTSIKPGINLWNPSKWEGKKQFLRGKDVWFWRVHDNIFDESNWKKLDTSEAEK